jgi:hypothetical protein
MKATYYPDREHLLNKIRIQKYAIIALMIWGITVPILWILS